MSLADYTPATEVVSLGKGSVTVRGLSLDDIGLLLKDHLEDLNKLLGLLKDGEMSHEHIADGMAVAIRLVQEAPAFVAQAIAAASDEPQHWDKARRMPIPVQIDIMKKVIDLTFRDAGGIKKFMESLFNSQIGTAIRQLTDSHT